MRDLYAVAVGSLSTGIVLFGTFRGRDWATQWARDHLGTPDAVAAASAQERFKTDRPKWEVLPLHDDMPSHASAGISMD